MTTLTVKKGTEDIILNEIFKYLDIHDGEEIEILKESNKVIIKKANNDNKNLKDFLPKDFVKTQKLLRKDSTKRFKKLGII